MSRLEKREQKKKDRLQTITTTILLINAITGFLKVILDIISIFK